MKLYRRAQLPERYFGQMAANNNNNKIAQPDMGDKYSMPHSSWLNDKTIYKVDTGNGWLWFRQGLAWTWCTYLKH